MPINKIVKINNITCIKSDNNDTNSGYGVFKGAMATEDLDRVGDIIAPDALDKTIADYIAKNRNIKIYYNHNTFDKPIGIIDPKSIQKNGKNWDVVGELNLETQDGREVYALMKQGALSDLSINCSVLDCERNKNVLLLKELALWEVSVVGEPANTSAQIYSIKGAAQFHDLPLAPRETTWSANDAMNRVRKFTGSEDVPSKTYRNAFFWFDETNQDNFGAYKLPFADIIGGKMIAVPQAIISAAAVMRGARGGVNIPEEDKSRVIALIQKYYDKMEMPSPWDQDEKDAEKSFKYRAEDAEKITTRRDFEQMLVDSGSFSRKASTILASNFNSSQRDAEKNNQRDTDKTNDTKITTEYFAKALKEIISIYKTHK